MRRNIAIDEVSKKEAEASEKLIEVCEGCAGFWCDMCGVYTALKILEQR